MSEQLLDRIRAYLRTRPDLTGADLAAHTTLGTSTVKKYLGGLPTETPRIAAEMERVMNLIEAGDILQPGGGKVLSLTERHEARPRRVGRQHGFYSIETVARVGQVLDWCAEQSAIGVVTGDYGVGKTEAVAAWRRGSGRGLDVIVFEFDEFTACNKVSFVAALAEALGLTIKVGMADGARAFRAVVDELRRNPCLLVFDQCEAVRPRVCQVIRQIWDRTRDTGVGVVLLAAPVLLVRLKASRTQDLGALESRIGVWLALTGVGKAEMAAIVKQEGITEVDEDAFDLWWRATGGSMRRLMATIDLLRTRHAGKRITERTITGVAGHLWGMQAVAGAVA